jgi:ribosomal protein S18 acetylase RimI-like enzyme
MAIVVAQINPKSGWSRITHMGIIPAFRSRKLGKWVHRHGFEMMRGQGGKLYHGGTVSTNTAMIRLFNQHGCKEYRRMQEWIYRF